MRKLLSGAFALTLTLALGACSAAGGGLHEPRRLPVPRADTTPVDVATTTPTATADDLTSGRPGHARGGHGVPAERLGRR